MMTTISRSGKKVETYKNHKLLMHNDLLKNFDLGRMSIWIFKKNKKK